MIELVLREILEYFRAENEVNRKDLKGENENSARRSFNHRKTKETLYFPSFASVCLIELNLYDATHLPVIDCD